MGHFHPKEVFLRAQSSEEQGNSREAANDYALLSVYFRKKNKIKRAFTMICQAIRLSPDSGRLFLEEAACLWGLNDTEGSKESVKKAVSIGIKQKKLQDYVRVLNKTFQDVPELRNQFYRAWLEVDRTQIDLFDLFSEELLQQKNKEEAQKLILQGLKTEIEHEALRDKLVKWAEAFGSDSEKEIIHQFNQNKIDIDKLMIILGGSVSSAGKTQLNKSKKSPQNSRMPSATESDLKDLGQLVEELEKKLTFEVKTPFENIEPLMHEFLRRSDQIIGSDPRARIDLAHAFLEMERLAEAKSELAQVEPHHELYDQAKHLLGLVLLQEGRDILALGAFREARRLAKPQSSLWKEVTYQLLKLYCKLNDRISAQKMYEALDEADPHYRELKSFKNFVQDKKEK